MCYGERWGEMKNPSRLEEAGQGKNSKHAMPNSMHITLPYCLVLGHFLVRIVQFTGHKTRQYGTVVSIKKLQPLEWPTSKIVLDLSSTWRLLWPSKKFTKQLPVLIHILAGNQTYLWSGWSWPRLAGPLQFSDSREPSSTKPQLKALVLCYKEERRCRNMLPPESSRQSVNPHHQVTRTQRRQLAPIISRCVCALLSPCTK